MHSIPPQTGNSPQTGISEAGRWQFAVTGYFGFEDEILRLRNANRRIAHTRRYLDWRYAIEDGAAEPLVVWLLASTGRRVGMASVNFRKYWIDGEAAQFAVLGDISLESELRGSGVGRRLLAFLSRHLEAAFPDCIGFVIPNEAAEKAVAAAGWSTAGRLIPHVHLTDPSARLEGLLRNKRLGALMGRLYIRTASMALRMHTRNGYSVQVQGEPDESFEALWKQVPKRGLVWRDLSVNSLRWRYARHPNQRFSIASLVCSGRLAGYLVFACSAAERICYVYDIVLADNRDLECLLSLFIGEKKLHAGTTSIRILLSDTHPYSRKLWRIGFFRRGAQAVFQVYDRKCPTAWTACRWALTNGDKDI